MLVKSRKRAERRRRSHLKFVRRVKSYWGRNGWLPDSPSGIAKFKDTPKLVSSCMCCSNPRKYMKGKNSVELTLHERRENQDREYFAERKRRAGEHSRLIFCSHCGIKVSVVKVQNGGPMRIGMDERHPFCQGCSSRGYGIREIC